MSIECTVLFKQNQLAPLVPQLLMSMQFAPLSMYYFPLGRDILVEKHSGQVVVD